LKYVDLPILTNKDCKQWYLDLKTEMTTLTSYEIQRTHLCTGVVEGGRDGCYGDSGGGLVMLDKDDSSVSVLVGITSVGGERCGEPRVPAIYTRVSMFSKWLKTQIV